MNNMLSGSCYRSHALCQLNFRSLRFQTRFNIQLDRRGISARYMPQDLLPQAEARIRDELGQLKVSELQARASAIGGRPPAGSHHSLTGTLLKPLS